MTLKAAFLDRDGVINVDKGYVHRWEDFEFVPGAIEGMRRIASAGFSLIVVTNQSGLARGLYSPREYSELTDRFTDHLAARGVSLTDVYHCPHHPDGVIKHLAVKCDCRKPAPGMFLRAQEEHGIVMQSSVAIGDKVSDVEAGKAASVGQCYLVTKKIASTTDNLTGIVLAPSLAACADLIVKGEADKTIGKQTPAAETGGNS